jgi:hypothetical protein
MGHQAFAELVMKGSRDHTVPYGDGIWRGAFPGTSCQATIDIVPPEQDVLLCDIRILLVVDLTDCAGVSLPKSFSSSFSFSSSGHGRQFRGGTSKRDRNQVPRLQSIHWKCAVTLQLPPSPQSASGSECSWKAGSWRPLTARHNRPGCALDGLASPSC